MGSDIAVYITNKTVQTLQSRALQKKDDVVGFLFGVRVEGQICVYGYIVSINISKGTFDDELDKALQIMPGGLELCGMVYKAAQGSAAKGFKLLYQSIGLPSSVLKSRFSTDSFLVLSFDQSSSSSQMYSFNIEEQDLNPVKVLPIEDLHFQKTQTLFRIRSQIEFGFEHDDQQDRRLENILTEVQRLEDRIKSTATIFRVVDSPDQLLLHQRSLSDEEIEDSNEKNTSLVSELLRSIANCRTEHEGSGLSKSKKLLSDNQPVDVRMSFRSTGLSAKDGCITCSPIIHHDHKQFQFVRLFLPIDFLAYAPTSNSIDVLATLFVESATRQLRSMANCLLKYSRDKTYVVPRSFHISLSEFDYLVTVIFPEGIPDSQLDLARKELHESFLIPTDRPKFRRLNALSFGDRCTGGYLLSVHNGLSSSGVKDGKPYVVLGQYAYHHYMQEHIDDNGWGCAYRSLQTVVSWFRLQGYTEKPVPTHREIQQALVTIGDKPETFVGSKKWIGSMEVSYVLDQLIQVTCKILHVSSGAEMATKARELAMHFETQGTPVMIGGGVLAHTILGVDWNEDTGDVKFLILDPHYTGGEDLKVIQDKGWCGWKSPDFWDKSAYYNMCLPQRPIVF